MDRQANGQAPERWIAFAAMIAVAIVSRLVSLQWLHPLQWDEVEYFRATDWVRQGLMPYRDYWEHHTPLQWFVFAPVTALTSDPGVAAIITMRWAQIPVWIATFALLFTWMRRSGIDRDARWAAGAIAVGSSLFMIPAVEYRIDTLGCALFVGGLVLAQRAEASRLRGFLAGVVFCLAGLANLRLGPLLAFTVLLLRFVDPVERRWRSNVRAQWIWGGAAAMLGLFVAATAAAGMLAPMYRMVWAENYLGDHYAARIPGALLHRLAAPFGVRLLTSGPRFDPFALDVGGVIVLLAGAVAIVSALRRWRRPDFLFVLATIQLVSVLFTFRMKNVYVYHFEIIVLLFVPLLAGLFERPAIGRIVVYVAAFAVLVSSFAAIFRGKELDRAYQDLVMRSVHAQVPPGGTVFDGVGWAIRREPAYRFWFLPDLARQLVGHGHAESYTVAQASFAPPSAVVADQNALVWLSQNPELAAYVVRHYLPSWRNLWVPGLSGELVAGGRLEWIVPRSGRYRVMAAAGLSQHVWLRQPLRYASSFSAGSDVKPLIISALAVPQLEWSVDGKSQPAGTLLELRQGARISVTSSAGEAYGVFVVPESMEVAFRQPPSGVSLDAAGPRTTHVPRPGLRLER